MAVGLQVIATVTPLVRVVHTSPTTPAHHVISGKMLQVNEDGILIGLYMLVVKITSAYRK